MDVVEILKELIKLPSHETSAEVVAYVSKVLDEGGVQYDMHEGHRDSLLAHLKSAQTSSKNRKTLLVHCHMDTMAPEDGLSDHVPSIRGDRLFGLGASDNKGSVAALVAALLRLQGTDLGEWEVLAVFSGKEEGVLQFENPTMTLLKAGNLIADAAIVLEATCDDDGNLGLCVGNYGLLREEIIIKGRSAHSAWPQEAVSAVDIAYQFKKEFDSSFHSNEMSMQLPGELGRINVKPLESITEIFIGEGAGTIPGSGKLTLDFRIPPYEGDRIAARDFFDRAVASIEDTLKEICSTVYATWKYRPEIKRTSHYIGYVTRDVGLIKIFQDEIASQSKQGGMEVFVAPGRSDACILVNELNCDCVVVGPGILTSCHAAEEHISVTVLRDFVDLLSGVVQRVASSK